MYPLTLPQTMPEDTYVSCILCTRCMMLGKDSEWLPTRSSPSFSQWVSETSGKVQWHLLSLNSHALHSRYLPILYTHTQATHTVSTFIPVCTPPSSQEGPGPSLSSPSSCSTPCSSLAREVLGSREPRIRKAMDPCCVVLSPSATTDWLLSSYPNCTRSSTHGLQGVE